mgnify:CR=1 FL=1
MSGSTKLFGIDGKKTVKGLRHFINNYLKGKLTSYDRKNIINHVNKLSGDSNFYKAMEYQKEINAIIEYAQGLISDKDINKIVSKNSNVVLIKNLVSKYIGYYLFLLIGLNYNQRLNNNFIKCMISTSE